MKTTEFPGLRVDPRQNSAFFSKELLVSLSAQEEVVDLSSYLRQPDEVAK